MMGDLEKKLQLVPVFSAGEVETKCHELSSRIPSDRVQRMIDQFDKIEKPRNIMYGKELSQLSLILEASAVLEKCISKRRDDLGALLLIQIIKCIRQCKDVSILKVAKSEFEDIINSFRDMYFSTAIASQDFSIILDRAFSHYDSILTEAVKKISPNNDLNLQRRSAISDYQIRLYLDYAHMNQAVQGGSRTILLWLFLPVHMCIKKLRLKSQATKWQTEINLLRNEFPVLKPGDMNLQYYEVTDSIIVQLSMIDNTIIGLPRISISDNTNAIKRLQASDPNHEIETALKIITMTDLIHAINSTLRALNSSKAYTSERLFSLFIPFLYDSDLSKRTHAQFSAKVQPRAEYQHHLKFYLIVTALVFLLRDHASGTTY